MSKWIDKEMPPLGDNTDGYKALALTVVLSAIKEYKKVTRALDKAKSEPVSDDLEEIEKHERKIKGHEAHLKSLEKFFRGEWCSDLIFFGTEGELDTSELDFVGMIRKYIATNESFEEKKPTNDEMER